MTGFVNVKSIVKEIWGSSDTTLFIFAGAAAEFALNKAVDWLYFTGRLPANPLDRLFSTVIYAQRILFSEQEAALKAIDQITAIHKGVEAGRGAQIPDWAYRDVLFMLIDYSIRSFEILQRRLTEAEKQEIFQVFYRVGERMHIQGLPFTYKEWQRMRIQQLNSNLLKSNFTTDLYKQYKKHLGWGRYLLMRQIQALLAPAQVKELLSLQSIFFIKPALTFYKCSRLLRLDVVIKSLLLPAHYKAQVESLDYAVPV